MARWPTVFTEKKLDIANCSWWTMVTSKRTILTICAVCAVTSLGYFNSVWRSSLIRQQNDAGNNKMSDRRVYWNDADDLTTVSQLVYNRVPKCGSATTSKLITKLGELNNFRVMFVLKLGPKRLNRTGQLEIINKTRHANSPWIYIQHFHLVNFTKYGEKMPLHINMIRDPVERKMSAYYYLRFKSPRKMTSEQRNRTFDECVKRRLQECVNPKKLLAIIPYFCGADPKCGEPSAWSLNRAKQNVIKYYSLVGYVEEIDKFYSLLEMMMPQYFRGLGELYAENKEFLKHTTSNKHSKILSPSSRAYLKSLMGHDYQFYNFIKQRFQKKYYDIM